MSPWMRCHERLLRAFLALQEVSMRRGMRGHAPNLEQWLYRRFHKFRICELTPAQARWAARQLNAWRGGVAGYVRGNTI